MVEDWHDSAYVLCWKMENFQLLYLKSLAIHDDWNQKRRFSFAELKMFEHLISLMIQGSKISFILGGKMILFKPGTKIDLFILGSKKLLT